MTRDELKNALSIESCDIESREIWIWGMGNTADLYQEGFKRMEDEGIFIKGYCDTYSWGGAVSWETGCSL